MVASCLSSKVDSSNSSDEWEDFNLSWEDLEEVRDSRQKKSAKGAKIDFLLNNIVSQQYGRMSPKKKAGFLPLRTLVS